MKLVVVLSLICCLIFILACVPNTETKPTLDLNAEATMTAIDAQIEALVDSRISAESTKLALPTQTPVIVEKIVTATPYVTPTPTPFPTPTKWSDVHCTTKTSRNFYPIRLMPEAKCDHDGIRLTKWDVRSSNSLAIMTEIYGTIENTTMNVIADVDIEFNVYDTNGLLIHSDWAYIPKLASYRTGSFISMGFSTDLQDIGSIRFIGIDRTKY